MTRLSTVSVFLQDDPLRGGNPLAVFPEADDISGDEMQSIARTLNLSETTFVTSATSDGYDVRIFTPREELPFAGHPTLGTAWVLRDLGIVTSEKVDQHTSAGVVRVVVEGDLLWFERKAEVEPDLEERRPAVHQEVARALGLEESEIGLEARELGRSGLLRAAFTDVGIRQLMVPVRDLDVLSRISPEPQRMATFDGLGFYVFAAEGAGRVRARGLFPELGILEDPATGSAAAGLGVYLAQRLDDIDFEIAQGVEFGRPCQIVVRGRRHASTVGGRCGSIMTGELERS